MKELKDLEGWGNLICSESKIFNQIIEKKFHLDRFIYSLGIRHIGEENAKLLARHLKSSDSFFKIIY